MVKIKFWGVRGSVPSPLTPAQVEQKVKAAIEKYYRIAVDSARNEPCPLPHQFMRELAFEDRSTYGGNTLCISIEIDDYLIILDMGTGIRELGNALLPQTIKNHGLRGTILQSHVHWDHIQGLPFFPQLYMPSRIFDNRFQFFGGKGWDRELEGVLRGQMNPPDGTFPVAFEEIRLTGMYMLFTSVFDAFDTQLRDNGNTYAHVTCRKLNHPGDTFGYRITIGEGNDKKVVTWTTDHEPYGGGLHRSLVDLARDADVWITECQYTYNDYIGHGGKVQKLGWGHSFPKYIGDTACEAKPKRVVTIHHDPGYSDLVVSEVAKSVEVSCGIPTVAAYEGMEIVL